MAGPGWAVEFHPDCEAWADGLEHADAEPLLAAVRVLRSDGPNLGRPLADGVKGSRHPNMKELRPGSTGRSEIRVLFAFDRTRKAILLVGGDKSDDWTGWYRTNIPIADDRFADHQERLAQAAGKRPTTKRPNKPRKGKGRR